jgi:hypothetical protein
LGSKKTTFSSRYEMCHFGFLFLGELDALYMSTKSHATQGVEPWENHRFPQGGMLKFTYKGFFFTMKIAHEKFLDWKSEWWKYALVPQYVEIFFWKTLKSRFLVVFQSFGFEQILAVLGKICYIDSS